MRITERQLRRIIRKELVALRKKHNTVNEGFFDFAADALGSLFGSDMPDMKATSMDKAKKKLAQALATYAASTIAKGGKEVSGGNYASSFDGGLRQAMSAAKEVGNELSKKIKSAETTSKPEKKKKEKKPAKKKGDGILGTVTKALKDPLGTRKPKK